MGGQLAMEKEMAWLWQRLLEVAAAAAAVVVVAVAATTPDQLSTDRPAGPQGRQEHEERD